MHTKKVDDNKRKKIVSGDGGRTAEKKHRRGKAKEGMGNRERRINSLWDGGVVES